MCELRGRINGGFRQALTDHGASRAILTKGSRERYRVLEHAIDDYYTEMGRRLEKLGLWD